jgi:hypothetical protein
MAVIFCASKSSIVAQWKKLLTCKDPYVAKTQKDLLSRLAKEQISPIVFIEERLYSDKTPAFIASLRTSFPHAKLLVLSHLPTFHGGQAMLGYGAHGYGNVYMAKAWLNDAYISLLEGENWLYPLQENLPKQSQAIGKISKLDGAIVDEFDKPLELGAELHAYQKLLLLEGNAKIEFDHGEVILLQGREPLMMDESVYQPQPLEIPEATIHSDEPVLERPFYINIGAQSLIAPLSDELEITPNEYLPVCPFVVEESSELGFAKNLQVSNSKTIQLLGPIEAYELIHSSSLQCVLINDIKNQFEGSCIVYEPIKTILFSNASVALSGVRPRQEFMSVFGASLVWDEVFDEEIESASIEVSGGRQGVDYVFFDRRMVPESLQFTYSLDEGSMGIYFEGIASRGDYQSLLQTLTYECSQNATMASLHVKLKVGSKNKTYTLLDEVIDTLGNTK